MNRQLKTLLPDFLKKIEEQLISTDPNIVIAAWNELIPNQWKSMLHPLSFQKGLMTVMVKNAALYSIMVRQEKGKLLAALREKFPQVEIKNIVFRIG